MANNAALLSAIDDGDVAETHRLITVERADPNALDGLPILRAVFTGNVRVLQTLIDSGRIDWRRNGPRGLELAISLCMEPTVDVLVAHFDPFEDLETARNIVRRALTSGCFGAADKLVETFIVT